MVVGGRYASSDDFKTQDGKEYKNVTISRQEPDGIVVITDSGISKLYFSELPKAVQERFGFDPQKAAQFSATIAEQQRLIDQKRQADLQAVAAQQQAQYQAEEQSKRTTTTKVVQQKNAGLLIKPGALTAKEIAENPFSLRGYAVEMTGIESIDKKEVAEGVYKVEFWGNPGFLTAKMTAAQCDSVARAHRLFVRVVSKESYEGEIPIEALGTGVTYEGLSREPTFYWK